MKQFIGFRAEESKTDLIRLDEHSLTLGAMHNAQQESLGGVNLFDGGLEEVAALVQEVKKYAAPEETRIFGSFSGLLGKEHAQTIEGIFAMRGFQIRTGDIVHEAELGLKLMQNDGLVIAMGTDLVCVAQIEGTLYQTGGWGYRLGQEASGYYIGQRAINYAIATEENRGWLQSDVMLDTAKAFFGVDGMREILPSLYGRESAAAHQIAAFAQQVLSLSVAGDAVARKIVNEAAQGTVQHIRAICKEAATTELRVGFMGGVFADEHSSFLREEIDEGIRLAGIRVELVDFSRYGTQNEQLARATVHHFSTSVDR
jgi:N-acetylglucosamine kinase-like BadF-type ATPase